jgi:hypothetical protein
MATARQRAIQDAKLKIKYLKAEKKKLPKLTKQERQEGKSDNFRKHDEFEEQVSFMEDALETLQEQTDEEYNFGINDRRQETHHPSPNDDYWELFTNTDDD